MMRASGGESPEGAAGWRQGFLPRTTPGGRVLGGGFPTPLRTGLQMSKSLCPGPRRGAQLTPSSHALQLHAPVGDHSGHSADHMHRKDLLLMSFSSHLGNTQQTNGASLEWLFPLDYEHI